MVAVQATLKPSELSPGMSFLMFAQSMGPTIFLVLCNLIFAESLKTQIPEHAPNANAAAIIAAGATKFRDFVEPNDLPGVLLAYSNSVDRVFYLVAGVGALAFMSAWGMGWTDVRKKTEVSDSHE